MSLLVELDIVTVDINGSDTARSETSGQGVRKQDVGGPVEPIEEEMTAGFDRVAECHTLS